MDEGFIRNRITSLRLRKGVSEYQMSIELGQNKGYIQSISSGRALPSMSVFLNICDYFEIAPSDFFDNREDPRLLRKAMEEMKKLGDDDIILLLGLLRRLES